MTPNPTHDGRCPGPITRGYWVMAKLLITEPVAGVSTSARKVRSIRLLS